MTNIPSIESDPCGRYARLNSIYDLLVTGRAAEQIEHEFANGERRRKIFTKANLPELKSLMTEARTACEERGETLRPRVRRRAYTGR